MLGHMHSDFCLLVAHPLPRIENGIPYALVPSKLVFNDDSKAAVTLGAWHKQGSFEQLHGCQPVPAGSALKLVPAGVVAKQEYVFSQYQDLIHNPHHFQNVSQRA